jgi:hypothetical protein
MGMFICDRCKKRWPDVFFHHCPKCYPHWAWSEAILLFVVFLVCPLGSLAALAWFLGLLS